MLDPKTATTRITAAAASVTSSPVPRTPPLGLDFGRCPNIALQKPVAVTVSGRDIVFRHVHSDRLFATGLVSSPNHPDNYPNRVEKQETIQVGHDMVISIEFTEFNIEYHPTCAFDHVTITDEDGTTLMEKSCGFTTQDTVIVGGQSMGSSLPANITSRNNSAEKSVH